MITLLKLLLMSIFVRLIPIVAIVHLFLCLCLTSHSGRLLLKESGDIFGPNVATITEPLLEFAERYMPVLPYSEWIKVGITTSVLSMTRDEPVTEPVNSVIVE
jgi:hypothetical protein